MFRFLQAVNESFDAGSNTYADLHRWSVEHLEEFWEFYRRRSGIHFHEPPRETLSSRNI
ncbi:MAG: hypothetical protein GWM98_08150, partial [Nitrospinaceae bacterium]|nr:hypothetical protein [Nitrospinaceae bacterium]NIR54475.1 hypothetical protein [Nitrospinaceae bacterium]NIS84894.1 hypothetical protein [Nitrospinaceae bacterium]NIT81706.1 hypothetical protein [Nitrospinaceae bacterium]NIU43977.1 hypothetical protein [Nitrospinaceae bacterium]